MTCDNPLRVGMVGLRNYAMVRRNMMREAGCYKMLACYNRSPEPMLECQKTEGAQPVSSYEELVNFPGLEAMIISTGAKFHAEQTIMALKKGLHVYVEKPLCSTPDELREIVKLQKKTGLVVGVGHTDHFDDPVVMHTKKLIDAGELGTIVAIDGTTAHSGGQLIQEGDWRGDADKNPGGMLFQCGVHKLHEMMFLFGPIVRVQSFMRYDANPKTKTADAAHCILQFKSGLTGTLNAYHITPYYHAFNIFGTKATLYRESRYFDEGIWMYRQDVKHNQKEERVKVAIPGLDTGKHHSPRSMLSFFDAIRKGGTVSPSLANGANAVAVVFAAEESAKTGRAVDVDFFE